ncbi:MAG: hypothetical protein H7326_05595 [Bdellovibrionaceae bacterium]|nr:hypothetical protein [Pseudobdellovibrionaceae bacterium]
MRDEKKLNAFGELLQIAANSCESVKTSAECKAVYRRIETEGGKAGEVGLRCEQKQIFEDTLFFSFQVTIGCAQGGAQLVKETLAGFYDLAIGTIKTIGETAAMVKLTQEKEAEENAICDRSAANKRALFTDYNNSVPKLLRIPPEEFPKDAAFANVDCSRLKVSLASAQRQKSMKALDQVRTRFADPNAKFTGDELEYTEWLKKMRPKSGQAPDILKCAQEYLKEIGINFKCYNNEQRAAMICEAIAGVAGGVAAKAASATRIAKIAKLEKTVDAYLREANAAKRTERGISGKITSEADRDKVLALASNLSPAERVSAFERITGKTMTTGEKQQYLKIHKGGEERGFGKYTDEDISEKLRLSQEINKETGKPFFTMEETKISMRNGLTGAYSNENLPLPKPGSNPTTDGYKAKANNSD